MRRGIFRNKKGVEEPTTADIMAVVGTIVIAVSIVVVFSVNAPSSIESVEVVLEEAEKGAAARMMMSAILSSYDEDLEMTGAQIISRMGADRQWAQDVGLDKLETILSGRWTNFKFEIRFIDTGDSVIWELQSTAPKEGEIGEIIQYLPNLRRIETLQAKTKVVWGVTIPYFETVVSTNIDRIRLKLETWNLVNIAEQAAAQQAQTGTPGTSGTSGTSEYEDPFTPQRYGGGPLIV